MMRFLQRILNPFIPHSSCITGLPDHFFQKTGLEIGGQNAMRLPKMNSPFMRHSLAMALVIALFSGGSLLAGCAASPVAATEGSDGAQHVKVIVQGGYQPNHIVAKSGKPLKMEFYRDEEPGVHSCVQDLAIPSEGIKVPLPARTSQIVAIKPHAPGEMVFQCGMNMVKGKVTFK